MTHRCSSWRLQPLVGGLAALLLAALAHADDDGRAPRVPLSAEYRAECAACHVAYPPGLLPAASWRRLMANLPRHFGADASLDEGTVETIGRWLDQHAGTARKPRRDAAPPPEDRITRSDWFMREHREVPAAAWRLPAVKGAARCQACHAHAAQGDFSEHDVRIPR